MGAGETSDIDDCHYLHDDRTDEPQAGGAREDLVPQRPAEAARRVRASHLARFDGGIGHVAKDFTSP